MCLFLCVSGGEVFCVWTNSRQVLVASVTWQTYTRCRVGPLSFRCSDKYFTLPAALPVPLSLTLLCSFISLSTQQPTHNSLLQSPTSHGAEVVSKRQILYGGLPGAGCKPPSPSAVLAGNLVKFNPANQLYMRVDKQCRRDKEQGGRHTRHKPSAAFHTHRGDQFANKKGHLLSPGSCLPVCVCVCVSAETVVHLLQQTGQESFAVSCLLSEDVSLCVLCYKNYQPLCGVPRPSCASLAVVHTGT